MNKMIDNWHGYSQDYVEQLCSTLNKEERELIEKIINSIRNPYLSKKINSPQDNYYLSKTRFKNYSLKNKADFENYFLEIFNQYDKKTYQKLGHILVLLPNIKGYNKKKNIERDKGEFEFIILSLLKLLLKHGYIDPNFKLANGCNFIQTALIGYLNYNNPNNDKRLFRKHSEDFIPTLIDIALKSGLDVNSKDNEGNTMIHTMIVAIVSYQVSDKVYEYTSIANIILKSLRLLGSNFNFNIANNDNQNIIDLIDYCIESATPLTGNSMNMSEFTISWATYYEKDWKKELSYYKQHIIDYIKNITNKNIACCIPKDNLSSTYKEILTKINRLELFLNIPLIKLEQIFSTEILRHIIDKQYIYYNFLTKQVKETILLIPELQLYVEEIFTFIETGQVSSITLDIFNCLSFRNFNDWDLLMINHKQQTPSKMLTIDYLKEFILAFETYYTTHNQNRPLTLIKEL